MKNWKTGIAQFSHKWYWFPRSFMSYIKFTKGCDNGRIRIDLMWHLHNQNDLWVQFITTVKTTFYSRTKFKSLFITYISFFAGFLFKVCRLMRVVDIWKTILVMSSAFAEVFRFKHGLVWNFQLDWFSSFWKELRCVPFQWNLKSNSLLNHIYNKFLKKIEYFCLLIVSLNILPSIISLKFIKREDYILKDFVIRSLKNGCVSWREANELFCRIHYSLTKNSTNNPLSSFWILAHRFIHKPKA